MSAILPPAQRVWVKVPVGKEELVWIALTLIWCLIMFAMMPVWHFYGKQNMSNEAYKIPFSEYSAKVTEMVNQYQVGTEGNLPVVAPPVGSDVYMYGGGFMWYPILELKKNESYRLHLSSADVQHGFSLQPVNINLQVIPGYDMVVTVTPDQSGDFHIICNEYCGIGHHQMLGKIIVKDNETTDASNIAPIVEETKAEEAEETVEETKAEAEETTEETTEETPKE